MMKPGTREKAATQHITTNPYQDERWASPTLCAQSGQVANASTYSYVMTANFGFVIERWFSIYETNSLLHIRYTRYSEK